MIGLVVHADHRARFAAAARMPGITEPSARRLIRKVNAAGPAVPDGSAQEHRKGRPARLYRPATGPARRAAT